MNPQNTIDKKTLLRSVIRLLSLLVLATIIIEVADWDKSLADKLYQWEGNNWNFKNEWFTAVFIHQGGKYFSITLALIVALMLTVSYLAPTLKQWNSCLKYVLVASLTSSTLVSLGKSISNISCPWDFSRYGGTLEYIPLIEQLWLRNGSHCFPAGHASAGFAWLSFYFVGRHVNTPLRWWALGFALVLGCTFGIAQQLRGAHFLSHDLWSFSICWMVSAICYEVMLKPYESAQ